MNYSLIYDLLVKKARNRIEIPLIKDRHHIIPKSMGGSNRKENPVFFTPREHYIAHHLLWKIHRNRSMHFAFWLLATKCSNRGSLGSYNVNSRTYQLLKERHAIEVSKVHTGKVRSAESKRKSSESLRGKIAWNKGLSGIYTDETLKKMSDARRGKKESEETRHKKSIAHTGVKRGTSPLKGRPAGPWDKKFTVICPHCKKQGIEWNMKRYHFDNCKNKEN